MRTLHRYIASSYLVSFLLTLVVFSFVMSLGVLFRATDLIARGVAWRPILNVVLSAVPTAMAFSIPMSALTSSLLVFGRLSADGEITAMKANGLSLWQIMSPPAMLSVGMALVCLFINDEIAPRSHFVRRSLRAELGVQSPLELLEVGRFVQDFPGLMVYVGQKRGRHLYRIRIYDLRTEGVRREILAQSGQVRVSDDGEDLVLDLQDVRVDPFWDDRPGALVCKQWSVTIPGAMRARPYTRHEKDFTMVELLRYIAGGEMNLPEIGMHNLPQPVRELACPGGGHYEPGGFNEHPRCTRSYHEMPGESWRQPLNRAHTRSLLKRALADVPHARLEPKSIYDLLRRRGPLRTCRRNMAEIKDELDADEAARKDLARGRSVKPALIEDFREGREEMPRCPAGGVYSLTTGDHPQVRCSVHGTQERVEQRVESALAAARAVCHDNLRRIDAAKSELAETYRASRRMVYTVELNKRLALSFSCFAFVLLGVPLGIKAHRKESSIGVAISLLLVFNFYLFIIVAEALARRPEFRPDLIAWLPVVISLVLGARLVNRAN